jgi:hypothetical protein
MSHELNLSFHRESNNNNRKSNSNEELSAVAAGVPAGAGSSPELRAGMSSAEIHRNAIHRGVSPGLRKLRSLSESLPEALPKFVGEGGLPVLEEAGRADGDVLPEEYEDLEEDVFDEFPYNENDDLANALFESKDLDSLVQHNPRIFDILIDALEPLQEEVLTQSEEDEDEEDGEVEDAASVIVRGIESVQSQLSQIDADRRSRNGGSNRSSARSSASARTTVSAIEKLARDINKAVEDAEASGEYVLAKPEEEVLAKPDEEVLAKPEEEAGAGAGVLPQAEKREKRKRIEKRIWEPEIIKIAIRRARKKAKPLVESQGALSNVSNLSSFTATKAFLTAMRGSRIEDYDPTEQAKFIFGDNWDKKIDGDTLCGYCRFPLKDRQPKAHYDDPARRLRYSLEHKTASNYQCAVLKIPLRKQKYSPLERLIMSRMSEVTCFHCNYIKSQKRFITCKLVSKVRDWTNLKPNVQEINNFLGAVYTTEYVGVNGKNAEGKTSIVRLIDSLNAPEGQDKVQFWKEKCSKYLIDSYKDVCKTIKEYVDYKNAYERVKLVRSIIRATRKNLIAKGLESKEIKKLVSKAALSALRDCDIQPWSAKVNDLDRATTGAGELPLPEFAWTPFTFREAVAKKRTRSKKFKNRKSRKNLRK